MLFLFSYNLIGAIIIIRNSVTNSSPCFTSWSGLPDILQITTESTVTIIITLLTGILIYYLICYYLYQTITMSTTSNTTQPAGEVNVVNLPNTTDNSRPYELSDATLNHTSGNSTSEADVHDSGNSAKTFNQKGVTRFMNSLPNFSGDMEGRQSENNCKNPLSWLRKMERLRHVAKLTDDESIIIASDHLTGTAERWYDVNCQRLLTWGSFVNAFTEKFNGDMENFWYDQLHNMRQGSNKMSTVESVALRLQELFTTLQIYTPKAQIRYFLDAIDPDLACQLEQLPTPFKSFNEVVEAAKRIESAKKRYQLKKNGDQEKDVNSPNQGLGIIRPPKIVAYASTASDSQTNILEKLLQQFTEMKLLLKKQQEDTAVILNNRQFRRDTTSVLTCYNCGQTGHKKPDCPKLVRTTPATGANVVPISNMGSQGKELGHQ